MGRTAGNSGRRFPKAPFAVCAVAAAGVAALAGVALSRGVRFVRADSGLAIVETVEDASGGPVRVLRCGGVYQSASYLDEERRFEPVFAYYRAFDLVFRTGRPVHDVLAVGGGGCSWPKHAVTSREDVRIDVVEVDRGIARAAERWFFVDEAASSARRGSSLALHVADGRAWLEGEGPLYDAVVNDAFSGREPAMALASLEAVRAVKRRLRSGGVYAANVVSRDEGLDVGFLRDVVATLCEEFENVAVFECSDEDFGQEDNYLAMASDGPLPSEGAIPFDEGFLGSVLHDA